MPSRISLALALIWAASGAQAGCVDETVENVSYSICRYSASDDIRLFYLGADGFVIGGFSRLKAEVAQGGGVLAFASNGGMYHDDRRPVGLFVENGQQITPLVTRDGPGNFGLLPNGVFCLGASRAHVIESLAFKAETPDCTFASQSGPLLVINGALHPRFLKDSDSRYVRNGVGVSADGQSVIFAISNERVNFHRFGRLFKDHLKTPNALYFDGKVSRLFSRDLGRSDAGFPMGPMIGVVEHP